MYPGAIWDGEWGRSRMDVLVRVIIVEGEGAVLGLNLGRPIVTNGDFETRHFQIILGSTCC